jgi:hypothetical protein
MNIEPKVTAATSGATVAAAVCWLLTHVVTHGALPVPVEGLVDVVVPGAVAFLGGYLARHQDRPSATVSAAIAGAPTAAAGTEDPARPTVAVQQPENPNPEGNTMSLLTQFEALAEDLRGKVISNVGTEVADEIHAAFDVFRGQGAQLLTQLGHDAQADATQVAADVAQVATDAAAAVTPAPAVAPEPVATPPAEVAPVEAAPVDPATVPDPAAPTA